MTDTLSPATSDLDCWNSRRSLQSVLPGECSSSGGIGGKSWPKLNVKGWEAVRSLPSTRRRTLGRGAVRDSASTSAYRWTGRSGKMRRKLKDLSTDNEIQTRCFRHQLSNSSTSPLYCRRAWCAFAIDWQRIKARHKMSRNREAGVQHEIHNTVRVIGLDWKG